MTADKDTAYQRLKNRIMLLSRGITLPPRHWWIPVRHIQSFYGGAGPRGRIYFISYGGNEDNVSEMISLPIYPKNHYLARYAFPAKRDKKNIHNLLIENGIKLIGRCPTKAREMKLSDGRSVGKTGLINVHCYGTYSTTASWDCRYFDNKEQCKYCTIDLTKKWIDTTNLSDKYIVEALKLTYDNSKIRSVTITGGTEGTPEETVRHLINLTEKVQERVAISIHVQFEPISDYGLFKELSRHVDSVGIFLEIFDEDIRKRICPGKGRVPKEKYFENWKEAVKIFGRGKVGTSCLLGFGESYGHILKDIEECIKLGVVVMPLLIRVGSPYLGKRFIPSYIGKEDALLDFHIKVAQLLIENDLGVEIGKVSGCIGCMGCSAIMEACQYVRIRNNNIT